MFFEQVIRPFIRPFEQASDYLVGKLALLISAFPIGVSYELFETPQVFWETLFYLMILDIIAKHIYIHNNTDVEWSADLLIRKTIFKGSSYIIVCTTATLMSNGWELGTNYLQYIAYLGLCILEVFSIAKHIRFLDYFLALFKELSKGAGMNVENIKDAADKHNQQANE